MVATQLQDSGFTLADSIGEEVLVTAAPPPGWDRTAHRAGCDAEVLAALSEPAAPDRPRRRALWRRWR
ncbi:hypothetical protein ABH940_003189 [Streptacidiphilus sp. BW17]|uniref:hypothetical protein n=1 Tax=unclassified Streptacidiphilus TaxID=2643834 RepID=UPI00351750BA